MLPAVGWFATHDINWSVPSSRLNYLNGYALAADLSDWQALTAPTKTLYINYIRDEADVIYLVVDSAPIITASAATNITAVSATLNAEIIDDGNVATANVTAYWGETDEGEVPLSWTFSDTLADQVEGTMHFDIDTLDPETLYYFKFAATNTEGTGWSATLNFTTEALILYPPTNLILTDLGANTITVEWVKGVNTTNTMVRTSRTDYPATVSDGELLYYDTGTTVNVTGWNLDFSTLYVSAWGYDVDDISYSDDYTTATIGGEIMLFLQVMILFGIVTTGMAFWKPNVLFGVMAGGGWGVVLATYLSDRPSNIIEGSAADNMAVLVLIAAIIGIFFWTFYHQYQRGFMGNREPRTKVIPRRRMSELTSQEYERYISTVMGRRR